jgi:hypothetical protein
VKSSTFQSAGYLKDTCPFGKVYVFSSAGAGADDGVVPGEAAPAPPPPEAAGVAVAAGLEDAGADAEAEAGAVAEAGAAAGEEAEGAAETMAPQPASERAAAAARAVMAGARNAGRMMVPFENDAARLTGGCAARRVGVSVTL